MLIVTSLFVLEICTVITVRFLMIARNNQICYNMCVELHMYSLSLVICAKIITYCKEYRQIPLTRKSVSPNTGFFLFNRFCLCFVCLYQDLPSLDVIILSLYLYAVKCFIQLFSYLLYAL